MPRFAAALAEPIACVVNGQEFLRIAKGEIVGLIGRNGSGKSSFAEALELLLTGDTYRWKKPRTAVWREGWRNLHHPKAAIEAAGGSVAA